MKKFALIILCLLMITMGACANNKQKESESTKDETPEIISEETEEETIDEKSTLPTISRVDITFQYQRASTHASNQIAIWVEDENSKLVKTILVTNFTAGRRGYRNREDSLYNWVKAANPDDMSDVEIDAISSATPSEGELTYSWDLTDENGNRVPDGEYTIKLEGTLYWESNVLYTAKVNMLKTQDGDIAVEELRSAPEVQENNEMIQAVEISIAR